MINCRTEKQNKNKSKKSFVGVAEKYLKTEKSWEVIREKLMFRMLWNTLKDGLCYLRNESASMNVFLLNIHEATDFIRSRKAYTSFNLLRILIFFPRITAGVA